MYKKILSGLAIIYLFSINTTFALLVKSYDLSGLGDLSGQASQYIDSITINNTSDIVLNVEFYDCDTNNEIRIEFLGTTYSLGCEKGVNNNYYNTSGAWYNVMNGTYELYLLTNTQTNKWGAKSIKLYISDQGTIGSGGGGSGTINNINVEAINTEKEAKTIYLFNEYDDLVVFFQEIGEVYFLILILMFLYNMFNKKDYEIGL